MKLCISGRMYSGKDYFAEQAGCTVYGFADPIYRLVEFFYGSQDKSIPGIRTAMQNIGQWGRGRIDDEHPLTFERHEIQTTVRMAGAQITGFEGDWKSFGVHEDFWVNLLVSRLVSAPEDRVAVTNARFINEWQKLVVEEGFDHVHVMCSDETRVERAGKKLSEEELQNVSEQFALDLDAAAWDGAFTRQARTAMFVWNDTLPYPKGMYASPLSVESAIERLENKLVKS